MIASPTIYHHKIGMDLLLAGVHVLVEKPLATSLDQAQELVDCAAINRSTLQVGHIERFNPVFNAVRDHIDQPKYIETRRFSGYSFRSTDIGVVLDVMIHDLDIVLALVDAKPVRIDAIGACVIGPYEDVAQARIAFDNGCVANLNASRVSYEMTRQTNIWCPRAFIAIDYAVPIARIVRPGLAVRQGRFDPDALSPSEKQAAKDTFFEELLPVEEISPQPCNALADELADFATAIKTGAQPRVPGAAGRDVLAVCEQILDSIGRHAWDGHSDGRIGPGITFSPATIPVPPSSGDTPTQHRRAG